MPSRDGGYFDESRLLLELPNDWKLGRMKRQQRENASETDFVFHSGSDREVNFIIKVHSPGDQLDHTPELLFQSQQEMLNTEYWLRKFKGSFLEKPVQFGNDLKVNILFRSLAHVNQPAKNGFTRMVSNLTRRKPEQIWFTECFQLFRFQVTVLVTAPFGRVVDAKKDYELALKQIRSAITNYATGKTVTLKLNR